MHGRAALGVRPSASEKAPPAIPRRGPTGTRGAFRPFDTLRVAPSALEGRQAQDDLSDVEGRGISVSPRRGYASEQ
jgi:hypothetical protein